MTSVASIIHERRIALELSEEVVAKAAGLSLDAYDDIEHHEDELRTLTPLLAVKAICALLGLDVLDLLGVDGTDATRAIPQSKRGPRDAIIRNSRMARGLSRQELAEAIGYDVREVVELESREDALEMWRPAEVFELAEILDVPVQILIGN